MKISIAKRQDELNALFIEEKDLQDWDNVILKLRGSRFDQIFVPFNLSICEIRDLLCYKKEKGVIYECRNIYE